jgi:hypothetical protein
MSIEKAHQMKIKLQRKHLAIRYTILIIIIIIFWVLFALLQTTDLFVSREIPLWLTASAIAESNATVQTHIQETRLAQTMTAAKEYVPE